MSKETGFEYRDDYETMTLYVVRNVNGKEVDRRSYCLMDIEDKHIREEKLPLNGLKDKLMDSASQVKPDGKLDHTDETFGILCEGRWNRERVGGPSVTSAVIEALAEIKGCSIPDIERALAQMSKEAREEVKSHPEVIERAKEIAHRRSEQEIVDLSDFS